MSPPSRELVGTRTDTTPTRLVLVQGRQRATERGGGGVRRVPVRQLRDYEGFADRLAEVLDAELTIRVSQVPPEELEQRDALVLCPWVVAEKWFTRGRARANARRCVVLDGDEEWLAQQGAQWWLAGGVDSAALSRWEHGSPFPLPVVVGRADAAVEIGASLPPPERWHDGYTAFTHAETPDVVELLARYLAALDRLYDEP